MYWNAVFSTALKITCSARLIPVNMASSQEEITSLIGSLLDHGIELIYMEISTKIHNWLRSYLDDCRQQTTILDATSFPILLT